MQKSQSAFTLFELIVVIIIIAFITLLVSTPYRFYGQKIYLKQSAKELALSLSEARNMALNGYVEDGSNQNILLTLSEEGDIVYYGYTGALDLSPASSTELKRKSMPKNIKVLEVSNSEATQTGFVISFEAVTDTFNTNFGTGGEVDFVLGYSESASESLKKNMKYYLSTFITDIY